MYYIVRLLLCSETSRIKPVYEVVGCHIYRHKTDALPFLMNALTSSFPQSMIARPVRNLLKTCDTIAVLQRSIAFDEFPLWHSRMFLNVQKW